MTTKKLGGGLLEELSGVFGFAGKFFGGDGEFFSGELADFKTVDDGPGSS